MKESSPSLQFQQSSAHRQSFKKYRLFESPQSTQNVPTSLNVSKIEPSKTAQNRNESQGNNQRSSQISVKHIILEDEEVNDDQTIGLDTTRGHGLLNQFKEDDIHDKRKSSQGGISESYLDSLIKPISRSGIHSMAETNISKAHIVANTNMKMIQGSTGLNTTFAEPILHKKYLNEAAYGSSKMSGATSKLGIGR